MDNNRLAAIWDAVADIQHAEIEAAEDPIKLREQVDVTADTVIRIYGEEAVEHDDHEDRFHQRVEASAGSIFARMVRVEVERRERLASRA